VLEAMEMQNQIFAGQNWTKSKILVKDGDRLISHQVLNEIGQFWQLVKTPTPRIIP